MMALQKTLLQFRAAVAGALLLAGAAALPIVRAQSGAPSDRVPTELRSYIAQFTGADPVDCGQHSLVRGVVAAGTEELQRSLACASESAKNRKSFWTFKQDQGIDSLLFQGLIGTGQSMMYRFSSGGEMLHQIRRLFGQWGIGKDPDDEFSWMMPPATLVDPAAWDVYWRDQFTHGMAGLVDMFCDDGELVDAMRASGLQTVLCVGNGISQEPRALAAAGFDVTALDVSPFAVETAELAKPPAEYLAGLIGGRPQSPDGQLRFAVEDLGAGPSARVLLTW